MGENIVERLARAIDPHAFKAWQQSYDYNLAQGETDKGARGYADWSQKAACDDARAIARAAIAALREPSEAMIEAGHTAPHLSTIARHRMKAGWQRMIDTALTEGTEHDQG